MLNHEFPRADNLCNIHFGFARMEIVVSPITPLGTIRAHPQNEEASRACFSLLELVVPSVY